MKNLQLIPLILFSVVLFSGCNGKKSENKSVEKDSVISTVFTVDSLLVSAEQLVNKTVTVEGDCSHLCVRSGKKLFLEGSSNAVSIRAEADKAFRQECIKKRVRVTGKLIEERIDEAYLADWENEIKAETETETKIHAGCESEKRAVGQKGVNTVNERIADFRTRIAEEKAKSGKDYLAFYHIETKNYRIIE